VAQAPIALIVALAQERRALERLLDSVLHWWTEEFRAISGGLAGQAVILIQAGIGQERTRRALLTTSRWFSIRAAWSLGFAGGLAEPLSIGDLVLPSVVLKDDGLSGQMFHGAPVRASVLAALGTAGISVHEGPLLSVKDPPRTPEAKRAAHQRTGATAVDMEAAGVAAAAQHLGIPWLALKSVVDPVDEPLPDFLADCTTERGDLQWRRLVGRVAASAQGRRTLGRLGRASRQAALRLRRALEVACRPGCLDASDPVQ